MPKFTVRGPGRNCNEFNAGSLDEAMERVKSQYPGKNIAADATEVIYVCDSAQDLEACQTNLTQ